MLDIERLQFLDLYSFELRLDYFEKILEFTSSSYSFYWLEAILNVMIYKDTIEFDEILDEMISLAYDDVVEKGYHLGPLIHQKRTNALENAILSIQKYLPENCSKQEIIICVKQHAEALKEYKKLLIMQTPYRLLSSFLVDVGGNDPIWNRPKDIIETIKDYNEKYRLPYIIENFIVVKGENRYINISTSSDLIRHMKDITGLPLTNYELSETQLKRVLNYKL